MDRPLIRPDWIRELVATTIGEWAPIVVTNRAPYEKLADGSFKRGAGGVVTAMLGAAAATHATWVACARNEEERDFARLRAEVQLAHDGLRGVKLRWAPSEPDEYAKHYAVVANPLLWFLQHHLWPLAYEPVIDRAVEDAWQNGYVRINRSVAHTVAFAASASAAPPLVLFQDYHLYLAPRFVREALPQAVLQHFVHIPWPTPQYWTVLSKDMRRAIFDGLLANDIVGFQTDRDAGNFLAGCEEMFGLRVDHRERAVLTHGRITWVRAYPVSIDLRALKRLSAAGDVAVEQQSIDRWRSAKLVVRVDRADPIKNVIRGFLAYEQMLDDHPELMREVQFWAFLQPSRQDVAAYTDYMSHVCECVTRINRRLGDATWQPIRMEVGESMARAVAAYKSFDVLLVNSIYDGMNLVAKEGPYINERDGVLVLSENAGSSHEIGPSALTINPFDISATANALYQALTMDRSERRRRIEEIRASVQRNDVLEWLRRQLQDIRALAPRPAKARSSG